ncbi:hypothetical protein CVT25_015141 [Psilocybe cyanescens]|uniref:Arginyl-tRNA synthetase n=1 Tax=Psilocybe cyanescens TaxID=93625 RepID=A0A409WUL4_PSICY|nr:hypothetical protein CVT25_015141 [Psilocybe cyanescens]
MLIYNKHTRLSLSLHTKSESMASSTPTLPAISGTDPTKYVLDLIQIAIAQKLPNEGGGLHCCAAPIHNPQETAKVIENFQPDEWIESIMPYKSFLHFNTKYSTNDSVKDKTVIMDHSSPNITKPFHVGHPRSTIIGSFLVNLYKACGVGGHLNELFGGLGHTGEILSSLHHLFVFDFGPIPFRLRCVLRSRPRKGCAIKHLFDIYTTINTDAAADSDVKASAAQWLCKSTHSTYGSSQPHYSSPTSFFTCLPKLKELWVIPTWFIIITGTSMVCRTVSSFIIAAVMFMNSNALPIALMLSFVVSVPNLAWGSDDKKKRADIFNDVQYAWGGGLLSWAGTILAPPVPSSATLPFASILGPDTDRNAGGEGTPLLLDFADDDEQEGDGDEHGLRTHAWSPTLVQSSASMKRGGGPVHGVIRLLCALVASHHCVLESSWCSGRYVIVHDIRMEQKKAHTQMEQGQGTGTRRSKMFYNSFQYRAGDVGASTAGAGAGAGETRGAGGVQGTGDK